LYKCQQCCWCITNTFSAFAAAHWKLAVVNRLKGCHLFRKYKHLILFLALFLREVLLLGNSVALFN